MRSDDLMVPFDLKSVLLRNFPSCHGVEFLLKRQYVQPQTRDHMKTAALSGAIEMRFGKSNPIHQKCQKNCEFETREGKCEE